MMDWKRHWSSPRKPGDPVTRFEPTPKRTGDQELTSKGFVRVTHSSGQKQAKLKLVRAA